MLHPKVKEQEKIDNLIFRVKMHKELFDGLIAELRAMKLSPEQKEKLIKILRK